MSEKSLRMRLISDAKALSQQLLRLESEQKAIDPHSALRLAEIILELYPADLTKTSPPWESILRRGPYKITKGEE